jgi:aquaporin Z
LKKSIAECIGTFVLTFVGCGVAMYLGCNTTGGVVGTSFAFGLSVVAMAYCIGNISGCHINPAISLGMLLTKRIDLKTFIGYVIGQLIGGILAGGLLALFAKFTSVDVTGLGTNTVNAAFYVNGEIAASTLIFGLIAEIVLTFIFVLAAIGVTDSKFPYGNVAGIVIGLTLVLVHLLGINITGTSVNPARSIGPALWALAFGNTEPIKEIWIFIVGPLAGAALAALCYNLLAGKKEEAAK